MELEPGIHRVFVGRGDSPGQYPPNTYVLVGQEGAALIDTGYDRDEEIQARLASLKELGNPRVIAIIVTHRHLDHVGRNLSDPLRDGPPMLRFEGEGAENQQVQGALWQIDACSGHVSSSSPFYRAKIAHFM